MLWKLLNVLVLCLPVCFYITQCISADSLLVCIRVQGVSKYLLIEISFLLCLLWKPMSCYNYILPFNLLCTCRLALTIGLLRMLCNNGGKGIEEGSWNGCRVDRGMRTKIAVILVRLKYVKKVPTTYLTPTTSLASLVGRNPSRVGMIEGRGRSFLSHLSWVVWWVDCHIMCRFMWRTGAVSTCHSFTCAVPLTVYLLPSTNFLDRSPVKRSEAVASSGATHPARIGG